MWILGSDVRASRADFLGSVGLGVGPWPDGSPIVVPIDPRSDVVVTIGKTGIARVEGTLLHTGGLIMVGHSESISVSPLTITPLSPTSFQEFSAHGIEESSTPALHFPRAIVQLHRARRQLVITCDSLMLSRESALALGNPGLSQFPIGFVKILADVELLADTEPHAAEAPTSGSPSPVTAAVDGVGPDIIVSEIQNMAAYGNTQVCRDSGEACAIDADCNACIGTGGPCLSDSDCGICTTSGVACMTNDDCMTCSGSGMPCTLDEDCDGVEICRSVQDCVLSDETCHVTGDACDSQIAAFSIATRSCNSGDEPADWISHLNRHPVISQNLFRLKEGRFEQIGMSWLKHGFFAMTGTFCGPCTLPPSSGGTQLGIGCSDLYHATLNGQQGNLGPRSDVNAHTGAFPYPYEAEEAVPIMGKRLQVRTSDLDLDDAMYFAEGHYVAADDAFAGNGNNNASYRHFELSQEQSGRFVFSEPIDPDAVTQQEQCGIRAWQDQDPSVVEVDVQIPGEGLLVIAAKATDLGTGIWQYEYAIQNLNSDRSCRSLEIPLPSGAVISEVGFHDIPYHSGETYDGSDWTATVTDSMIKWSTASFDEDPNANALRWGTLYNFRFDADAPPDTTSSTVGL
ncbi:MAG: hypothetical protein IH987_18220, partial [Planctomycetes bacterium]|nr:hypothetical protein [Planctomycetota bacterium]